MLPGLRHVIGFEEQRSKVVGLHCNRLVHSGKRGVDRIERPTHVGEPQPRGGAGRPACRELFEESARGLEISPPQRFSGHELDGRGIGHRIQLVNPVRLVTVTIG